MSLEPGQKLGPYEILSPLGAGGMGEVYRARDTRLGREVAVKVLPGHLSSNAALRARFEREAKTVSSLNHPHICTLFDVGREGQTDYLVMELIEGETLAARLERGPLPLADVLRIGREIADALEKAHRVGVVHRDLKPGNVMLTKSSTKLMDFGLARLVGPSGSSEVSVATLTASPTLAPPLTAEGALVGTFQYMAPEQLEGKDPSPASDLWAFGCVIYEMATGRHAFEGGSQASLITAIMGTHPASISQFLPLAPPALSRLVDACLTKDPADRFQSAHDLKLQLSWLAEDRGQPAAGKAKGSRFNLREPLAWAVALPALVVAGMLGYRATRAAPSITPVFAMIEPPPGAIFSSSTDSPLPLAISPDGSTLAFCARNGEGPDMLWVRSVGADDARPLAGTEGAEGPFFSPDGRSLGFFSGFTLKRVDVTGGPVVTLVSGVDPRGGAWNRNGDILFTSGSFRPLSRISAEGGETTTVTKLDSSVSELTHRYPYFLPDGRHFLYLARRSFSGGRVTAATIYAQELGSDQRTPVLEAASNVVYASGYLLYVRESVLVAQRFNPSTLKLEGPAVPMVTDVRMDERFSRAVFAASANGVLACMRGDEQTRTQLRWYDRTGKVLGNVGEPADYTFGGTPNISPDGRRAVIAMANRDRGNSDVWLVDLETGRRSKLTLDNLDHPHATWLPDGRSVAVVTSWVNERGVDAFRIDGTRAKRIVSVGENSYLWPMTAWGDLVLYWPAKEPPYEVTIQAARLDDDAEPSTVLEFRSFDFPGVQFSPDGRYFTYVSTETGRGQVYVASFPQPGGRWQVSSAGGHQPRWNRNGKEIFYRDAENYLVSVEVAEFGERLQAGDSRRLFQLHASPRAFWTYDVSPDGNRFLFTVPLEKDLVSPVTLITDWTRRAESR